MARRRMIYFGVLAVVALTYVGWKLTARSAYESAEYGVLVSESPFETREYPDLMMATTNTQIDSQGNDGSFMRLFRYISGANSEAQKVAMTTPVFMEAESYDARGQMSFVIPRNVTDQGIPEPTHDGVKICRRAGGKFAVIRFSGRVNATSFSMAENRLRKWMEDQELIGDGDAEMAGYDPPWTPGPLRRNEILIRLK